ncbi:MAG: hypothetical protein R3C41_16790 [Calditrichia bacterium]
MNFIYGYHRNKPPIPQPPTTIISTTEYDTVKKPPRYSPPNMTS